jgi:inorganic pyrophosphatase
VPVRLIAATAILTLSLAAAPPQDGPPRELPASATSALVRSLEAAARRRSHIWRDQVPVNPDGTVNAYIEIGKGDRRKWEFDMRAHRRAIDRMMPASVGAYPVNYGFVPQTVSYDGDPFDALVLGDPIPGGRLVRGVIVGLMVMDDEKGLDAKVVLARMDSRGEARDQLTADVQRNIGEYFDRYKAHEAGKRSNVSGWEDAASGRAFVETTHRFFRECRQQAGRACRLLD